MDGVNNNGATVGTYAVPPIVDAIQEFKVQSHNDLAEFGQGSGGIVNVVTRSGTNDMHGTGWWFLRNDNLDARNFFRPVVTPLAQNMYGGTLGGKVVRNKTFYFLSYQGYKRRTPANRLYRVPTAANLQGDLSDWPLDIYDPFTTRDDGTGAFIRDIFPNNMIPQGRLDPGLVAFAQATLQAPIATGVADRNALDSTNTATNQEEYSARADHSFSENDTVWVRVSGLINPSDGSGGRQALGSANDWTSSNIGSSWVHTFNPTSIMQLSFARTWTTREGGRKFVEGTPDPASFGFSQQFCCSFRSGAALMPNMSVSQFFSGGEAPSSDVYNALGAFFAQNNLPDCSIGAFKEALLMDPEAPATHFNLGLVLMQVGRPEPAVEEFRQVTQLQPDMINGHLALGMTLLDLGRYSEATRPLEAALEIDPQSTQALDQLAQALIAQGDFPRAIAARRRAVELEPQNLDFQLALGVAHAENGSLEEAVSVFERAVEDHPNSPLAHLNLGTLFARLDRYDEAALALREALKLNPENAPSRLTLAKVLVRSHHYGDALIEVDAYIAQQPADFAEFDAAYVRGVALRQLGRLDEAEGELRRAVELNDQHSDAQYQLGFVLARQQRLEEARSHLEQAKALNPESPDIRFQLASVLRRLEEEGPAREEFEVFQRSKLEVQRENEAAIIASRANQKLQEGDAAVAVELYRQSLEQAPRNAKALYNLSVALGRLARPAERRGTLEQAVAADPQLAEARNDLGLIYAGEGRYEEAEAEFLAAVAANPSFAEARNNLGFAYSGRGKHAEAERVFRQALDIAPRYAEAHRNLGLVLAEQEKFPEAARAIEDALSIEPDNAGAHTALGMVLTRLERPQEAVPHFRKVIELQPDSAEAQLNLGIVLADHYDLEGALDAFSQAVDLAPSSAAAHYNKGRALYDLGRGDEAKRELETATNLPAALYLLAQIEEQQGSPARALALLREFVALEPGNADGHYMLGQSLAATGQAAEAVEHWKRAVELSPGHARAGDSENVTADRSSTYAKHTGYR